MSPEKKSERIALLTSLAEEVHSSLLSKHLSEGGDEKEIVFNRNKIIDMVEDYDRRIEAYRERHIGPGKLIDADKIAAFTSVLIMRHWIFESETNQVNTEHAEFANETFAIRACRLFLRKSKAGFTPPDFLRLLHCFSECTACDDCLRTWTVATMATYLHWGNVQEPIYAD